MLVQYVSMISDVVMIECRECGVSVAPLLGSVEFSLLYSALDYTLQCVIHRAKVPSFARFSVSLLLKFTEILSVNYIA